MRPALEALVATNFYDQNVQNSAKEFVELAVSDSIDHISNIIENNIVPGITRETMVGKLQTAKLWVMFPNDILNVTKIEGLYKEFDFDGSENFIEMNMKILSHFWKLRTRPEKDAIKILQTVIQEDTTHYFADVNILSKWVL